MFQHWIHIISLWKRFQGGDIGVVDEESFDIVYMIVWNVLFFLSFDVFVELIFEK